MAKSNCYEKLTLKYSNKYSQSKLKQIDKFSSELAKEQFYAIDKFKTLKKELDGLETAEYLQARAKVISLSKLKKNYDNLLSKRHKTAGDALLSMWEGTVNPVKGAAQSVENLRSTWKSHYLGYIDSKLRSTKLLQVIQDPNMAAKVMDEYIQKARDPNYMSKYSPAIQAASDAINQLNTNIIKDLQGAGSSILFNAERIISNMHDVDKIVADKKGWVKYAMEALDIERSFGPTIKTPKQMETALKVYYDTLLDYSRDPSTVSNYMGGVRGMYFKDGLRAFEYNSRYGHADLYTGIKNTIDSSSKKMALTQVFGDNPIKEYATLERLAVTVEGKEGPALIKAKAARAFYSGQGHTFGSPDSFLAGAYKATMVAKTYEMMTSLGKAGLATTFDIPTSLATLKTADGSSMLNNSMGVIKNYMQSIPKESHAKVASELGVLLDDLERDLLSEMGQYKPGLFAKIADGYSIANLTKPLTIKNRKFAVHEHAKSLHKMINSEYGSLNKLQKQSLSMADITARDVKDLRGILDDKISIEKIYESDLPSIRKVELMGKVGAYLNMRTSRSVVSITAKTSRWINRELPKDDPTRIASEIMSQFKSSLLSLSTTHHSLIKEQYSALDSRNASKNIAQMASFMFMFAYAKEYVQDKGWELLTGEEDDSTTIARISKAMSESTFGGLIVDYALAQGTGELWKTGAPIAGLPKDLWTLGKDEFKLNFGDYKARRKVENKGTRGERLGKVAKKNIPGNNLWFIDLMMGMTADETTKLLK